jgi:hypothetical protein
MPVSCRAPIPEPDFTESGRSSAHLTPESLFSDYSIWFHSEETVAGKNIASCIKSYMAGVTTKRLAEGSGAARHLQKVLLQIDKRY